MQVSGDILEYTFIFVGAEEYYVWLNNKLQTCKSSKFSRKRKIKYYYVTTVDSPAKYVKRIEI